MIKKYFDDMYDVIQKRWWARIIAHHCYFEGTNNTTEGNYIFNLDDLGIENCPEVDDELIAMIMEELNKSPYVLDAEYTKEEDGTRLLDINFSTIFIEEYPEPYLPAQRHRLGRLTMTNFDDLEQ